MKKSIALLCALLLAVTVHAAVVPADGAMLHYRLIGFMFQPHNGANSYLLEIYDAADIKNNKPANKPLLTKEGTTYKIIATVPAFDKNYAWRIVAVASGKTIGTSQLHYFSVDKNPYSTPERAKVVVIDSAAKYKDMLVFFDNTRSLHNMQGEPVWYLPSIHGITDSAAGIIRDMKMTNAGTITFLTTKNIYEIDYQGNVLWAGPNDGKVSGDTAEQYHHEVTRLANGNYMTIGNKMVVSGQLAADSASPKNAVVTGEVKTPCGTVIEYNRKKEVVWTWNSCDHINMGDPSTHFNASYLDVANRVLYTSYRNISRIVKARYPSGDVVAQYGQDLERNGSITGRGLFYYQHNCSINSDGNLMLFNNNFNTFLPATVRNTQCIPTVAIFKEPAAPGDTLRKIWEFRTDIDNRVDPISSGGGSVRELGKGDYLVCTGMPGRNFIVSRDKKVLWNVLTQQYTEGSWKPFAGYRISPVFQADVEKLLFR